MMWTDELKDQVAAMLRKGLTASQIAARLEGVSRNAVVGVVNRDRRLKEIGFKRSPGPQNTGRKRDLSIAAKRRRGAVRGGKEALVRLEVIPTPSIADLLDAVPDTPGLFGAPQVAGMPLIMLTDCRCKWPLNDGGPFLFCGEAKQPGRPYCAYHSTAALGNGTESERSAVRSALKVAA